MLGAQLTLPDFRFSKPAFNKISLGNGYTAYLYNIAPSAGTHLIITLNRKPNEVHNKTNAAGTHYRGVTRR
jgi:hypothetical protein